MGAWRRGCDFGSASAKYSGWWRARIRGSAGLVSCGVFPGPRRAFAGGGIDVLVRSAHSGPPVTDHRDAVSGLLKQHDVLTAYRAQPGGNAAR